MKSLFTCVSCGYKTSKWLGKCPGCGEFSSFEEVLEEKGSLKDDEKGKKGVISSSKVLSLTSINNLEFLEDIRYDTGEEELNRVLGGGVVKGSLVLVGGAPGIGKSTLLLQICQYLGKDKKVLYVSGEESAKQIKLRANRLKVSSENLFLISDVDIDSICNTIISENPDFVIVDSIQTMYKRGINSSPGSITQVRESTNLLMRVAKEESIPIFVVGHINKDGNLAGPKILEHMVDTVLYFEGENDTNYRILRTIKNRFGSTGEVGVFDMTEKGLIPIENPSKTMLEGRLTQISGSSVICLMEGTRPILTEVQALSSTSTLAMPRRSANGIDYNRLSMLLAVLEKRAGIYLSNKDIYINVIGGLKAIETGSDLAICLAIASSIKDIPCSEDVVALGEVGLGGELRTANNIDARIKEIKRLGFKTVIIPKQNKVKKLDGINIIKVSTLKEAINIILN